MFQTLIQRMLDSKLGDNNERGRSETIYKKEYEVRIELFEISFMHCLPKPRPHLCGLTDRWGGLNRQLDEGIGQEGVRNETRRPGDTGRAAMTSCVGA